MNKRLKALSCALVAIFALSVAPNSTKIGPFGVDAVSAATTYPPTPAKPATPSKPSKPSTNYTPSTNGASTGYTRLIKFNSMGSDVKDLQTKLNNNGYKLTVDGIFGNLCLVAVKNYQISHGLQADGMVGPATHAKLNPPVMVSGSRLLRLGAVGNDVTILQTSLNKFGYKLMADNFFGKLTLIAVQNFQGKNGLAVDGLVGPATLAKLAAKPVVVPPVVTPPVVTQPTTKGDVNVTSANYLLTNAKIIGNVYVSAAGFTLSKNAKVEGNVYFTTQEAKDTFKMDATSSVTGNKELVQVDVVTTASIVNDVTAFENAISAKGAWIAAITKDLTTTKALVLDGDFMNTKVPAVSQRKIALYAQDDKRVTTHKFTLTAPKLTIKSIDASIQKGIFVGDIYVSAKNFQLVDAKVVGNVYFTTQEAKDTFKMDATSSVSGNKELVQVDAVASASLVNDVAAFENAISTKGNWIASVSKDLTTTKELVLDGDKVNTKTPPVSMRKVALYSQDDKYNVTRRFTLTTPKLTIKSVDASIQKGIFVGDIYVSAKNFQLIDTKVIGNVYFTTTEAQTSFKKDATSSISGKQELIQVVTSEQTTIKVGRAEAAAHGTKCFTVAVVAMSGDKIVAASIDDYQFMAKATSIAVPNYDLDFGKNFTDLTKVLASKRTNSVAYSQAMKDSAGATISIDKNYDAVQAFAVGKTIAQLEAIIKTNGTDPKVDAVTSATLTDTNGYLNAIVAAAKTAKENSSIQVATSALNSLKIGRVEAAAHGTRCFTVAVTVMAGDKIVGASIDDYQFMAKATSIAVPNSDLDFGKNYADVTKVLASKRANAEAYSKNMKDSAGATIAIDVNYNAVQAFADGKTVAELEAAIKANGTDPKVDAVTSATLTDTNGYLNAILAAAKVAK